MFIHVEFQMRPGDYPIMMTLKADFEENNLWGKLGLALREGAGPNADLHPNYYIDKVRGHIFLQHPEASWDIQCTDLSGQVWGLRYLQPGLNPMLPGAVRNLNMRITKSKPKDQLKRKSRYHREPVI